VRIYTHKALTVTKISNC